MDYFITNVVPILELIMSFIGVVFLFKPSEPTVSVDVGNKYYFTQSTTISNSNNRAGQSGYGSAVIPVFVLFGIYLFYSVVGKLMIFIIAGMSFCKIVRYRLLGIDSRRELISPIFSILAFYLLNFVPITVKEFWENNTKLDFSKFNGLSEAIESILAPLPEFFKLFTNFEENRVRNISIFAILFMTLFVILFEGSSLFRKKQNIRVQSISFVISYCVILFISLGFVFYHIEKNPVRIVTELIINWFNN